MNTRPVAIFYEHPTLFKPLFQELTKRSIPFVRINATEHTYNPAEREVPYSILINRVSTHARYIAHVERLGIPVLNGTHAQEIEASKARQLELLASLGMPFPKTRIINHVSQVIPAARGLRFPVVIKVNLPLGQKSVRKFSNIESLQRTVELGQVNLGVDHSAIIQEYIHSDDKDVVRVETLNGKFLYALKGSEAYSPPQQIVRDAEVIAKAARLDSGAVEYVTDTVTGQIQYCNIFALSNFITNPLEVLGFDPTVSFVDYIEERLWPNYELEPVLID